MDSAEGWRLLGNEHFAKKEYTEAIDMYTKAGELAPANAVIWSNRSACYLSLNLYSEAEIDARRAIELDSNNVKAYYRLGLALFETNRPTQAVEFISKGLELEPGNSQLRSLKFRATKSSKQAIPKGFLLESGGDHAANCAPDCSHVKKGNLDDICQTCTPAKSRARKSKPKPKEPPVPVGLSPLEVNMYNEAKTIIKKLKSKSADFGMMGGTTMLQGAFANLLNESTFQSFLFPGSPPDVLEVLPKNISQLLAWEPIEIDISKIAKQSASILEGVKKRGATRGDVMDSTTELILKPQIVQESIARELVETVKKVSKVLSNWKAKTTLKLADSDAKLEYFGAAGDDEAVLLEENIGEQLLSNSCTVQSNLMGPAWSAAILKDVCRFASAEKMTPMYSWQENDRDILPRVAWIEKETMLGRFPAIAEGLKQLQYLPFELNELTENSLGLLTPTNGCTMLIHFPVGSKQPLRLDNYLRGENPEDQLTDSGIRVTCSYHLCPEQLSSSLFYSFDETSAEIPIENDQLVIHFSTKVRNERRVTTKEYFVLQYFIHGKS